MSSRRRRAVNCVCISLVVQMVALGLVASPASAATAASPITYVYDAIGRLQAVIDPSTATPAVAKYNYDNNGNLLSIARTNPTGVTIVDFHGKTGKTGDPVTIYGTGFNTTPAQNKVTFTKSGGSGNTGAQATVTSATSTVLEVTIPSGVIVGTIWVKNLGTNKTVFSTQSFTPSTAAPTITGFTDMAGAAITRPGFNTQMKITGSGFSSINGANVVTFNNVRGIVDPTLSTATTLVVTTPPFTTTGAVEVRTPDGKARSATELVFPSTTLTAANLTPIRRVAIGGASTSVTVAQEQAAMVMFEGTKGQIVQVSFSNYTGSTSEKATLREPFDRELAGVLLFNSTASMSATLPHDGDYAIRIFNDFQPTPWSVTVSVTQTGMARVSAGDLEESGYVSDASALQAVRLNGPVIPEVWVPDAGSPSGWLTGAEDSVFESTLPLEAPRDTTGIFGRVLSLDGLPLAGVPVRLLEPEVAHGSEELETVTDELGRFLLEDVPAGRVVVYVDGASMQGDDDVRFGSFPIGIDTDRGQTVSLDQTVWLPREDTATTTEIGFPTRREIVLTHPAMPGFEVHIPRGTRVKTVDGERVQELTLTPIPLDRPPFAMPSGANPPAYWTVQPGGATLWPKAAWVVYPAPDMSVPGQRQGFYTYEPDEGWEGYGYGTVDESGEQVIPNEEARIHAFSGATIWGFFEGWWQDAQCEFAHGPLFNGFQDVDLPPSHPCFGDPVDVGSGLFRSVQRDLIEPGPIPIELTRTYRQNDTNRSYLFGLGMPTTYELFLKRVDPSSFCRVDLFLPGQRRVRYTSPSWPANPAACDPVSSATGSGALTSTNAIGQFAGGTLVWEDDAYHVGRFSNLDITNPVGTVHSFDEVSGTLESIHDRFNNEVFFPGAGEAVGNWAPASIVSYPTARFIGFNYGESSEFVTQSFDAAGRRVNYAYENPGGPVALRRLVSITDAEQSTKPTPVPWLFDWNNSVTLNANPSPTPSPGTQLLSMTDPRGSVALTNHFDGQGRVDLQTLATTGTFSYEYSSTDTDCQGQTKLTDPNGNVSCYSTNGEGLLTQRRIGVGTTGERTFDFARNATTNRLDSITDSFQQAGGGTRSRTTSFGYDAKGRITSIGRTIKRAGGQVDTVTTTYAYDPTTGGLASITDPLMHATSFTYANGCVGRITDDLGNYVDVTCTSFGAPKTITTYPSGPGSGLTTTLTYARGDLIKVTDPLGRSTSQLEDGGGRPVVVSDPLRYRSILRWTGLDDPAKITDPLGNAVDLTYDGNRNLTRVELPPASGTSGPRGTTTYAYDSMNRLLTRTDQLGQTNPSGHQDIYTRDLNGNVLTWTNRRGQVMRFCYDAFDQRTFAGYAASGGNPTCASTFQSSTAFTWDDWGRLTTVADTVSGVTSTITRDYDDLDRLTNETTPYGAVAYAWDDASRRDTMTVAGQTLVDYDWFRNDLLKTITQGTATVTMAYDQANRLDTTTLANGIVQDNTLDGAGGITQISYDKGTTAYGKINHATDAAGRRTKMWGSYGRITLPAATTATAVYNLANRLTSWNGQAVTHDADGNLTAIGTQTSTWNARGQLTATSAGGVGYGYDGLGRRVSRSVSGAPNARYLYDGWNLVQEQSGAGSVTANSLMGLGLGQAHQRSETSGTTRNYLSDALGSTLALTSGMATPTVNTEYTYEPYGKPTTTGTSTTNPFAFTGLVWDSGSGLYDNRYRQLNPSIARFGSEDPIDVLGGWNIYAYARLSPNTFTDPTGLDPGLERGGGCLPSPGYDDLNITLLFGDVGLISDSCGTHAYGGVGFGIPGASLTTSPQATSCESDSAQLFFPVVGGMGPGGGAGWGNTNAGGGPFAEGGWGSGGFGLFTNWVYHCPQG